MKTGENKQAKTFSIYPYIPGLTIICCLVFLSADVRAQLPVSQAWLLEISPAENSDQWQLAEMLFLSSFNDEGYNNQPFFADKNTLYLSSGKDTVTNLYSLSLHTEELKRITGTRESEFSPRYNARSTALNFVRLEKDGTQRVWNLPHDRSNYGSPITPLTLRVGYYSWLDSNTLALFVIREDGNELIEWNVVTGKEKSIAQNPGRSMESDENGVLYYTVEGRRDARHIYSYNFRTGNSERLVRMIPGGSQDFCIGPDNTLFTSADGMLMAFRPGKDSYWKPQFALNIPGATEITRIASDKNGQLCIITKP